MSSRKRQQEKKHYGLRKRARLGDITNSKQQVQLSAPCPRPVSFTDNCINQCVPENEFPPEETDTSMFCSENFDFLPSKRKQTFPKRCVFELTPGGLFSSLPTEVLHKLFSLLDLESMVSLCLSSTVTVSYIHGYMYTPAGLAHVLPPLVTDIMNSVCIKKFRLLGMIVKAVSVLDAFKNRLKVAAFFLDKLHPVHLSICRYLTNQATYRCFGAALNAFVSGWEDSAKTKAYDFVKLKSKIIERTSTVLQGASGSLPLEEKDIRALHREVFLCPVKSDEEYAFWLTLILKPWPLVFQAKLLYLITAPGDASGKVYWVESCGCSRLQHTSTKQLDFSELARALRVLYSHKAWTDDDIFSIFNEITTSTSNGWCLENVSLLLFGCGTAIVTGVLESKAINGHTKELGMILFYIAHCCVRGNVPEEAIDKDMAWFVHILFYVTRMLPDKDKFVSDLVGKWQTYILTLLEDHDPVSATDTELADFVEEFHSTISSITRLCQALIQNRLRSSVERL